MTDAFISAGGSLEPLDNWIARAIPAAIAACQATTVATGNDILDDVVESVSHPGSGRSWPGLPNPSSEVGSPPAIQSGSYKDSWGMVVQLDTWGATVTVGTDSSYGWRLEAGFQGVDSLGRLYAMKPRPHLGPAIERHVQSWANNILDEGVLSG